MLKELLNVGRIAIVSGAPDRAAVIDAAARLLALPADTGQTSADPAMNGVHGPEAVRIGDSLHSRERLASTAIGHGVAIPHGRVDFVDHTRGAFLRLSEPVDFGAADGLPVDLVLAMVVPQHSTQKHLHQLAELAEYFSDPDVRHRLREADGTGELTRCLLAPLSRSSVA